MLAGRSEQRLDSLAAELGAESFCLDASNLRQVESCMKRAAELHGHLNGVANCVGSLLLKPAHFLSEEEWDATVDEDAMSTQQGPPVRPTTNTLDFEPCVDAAVPTQFLQLARPRAWNRMTRQSSNASLACLISPFD